MSTYYGHEYLSHFQIIFETSAVSSVKWWVGFDEYFETEQGGILFYKIR